jgi:hypothetical protein
MASRWQLDWPKSSGKDVLYSATDVVRLGEKKLLQSEDDWEFLAKHFMTLNQNWPRFLAEQRRTAADRKDASAQKTVEAAYAVLDKLGLDDTSDVNRVIDRIAAKFFSQKSISLPGCVQLAQIAAKLGATAGNTFRYATRGKNLRSIKENILFDEDGKLEDLLPEQQQATQLLHPTYIAQFSSCSREEWLRWVSSGRAGLVTFIPLVQKRVNIYGEGRIEQEARKRGLKGDLSYPYATSQFVVEDWDFEDIYWHHWQALAASDDRVWAKVANRVLSQRDVYWKPAKSARLLQIARNGYTQLMT